MRHWAFFTALLLSAVGVHSFHYHTKHLLPYLLLSQLSAQRKLIVVPLLIPVPVGLIKGLFRRSYRSSSPAEIYIHSSSSCQSPLCSGGSAYVL